MICQIFLTAIHKNIINTLVEASYANTLKTLDDACAKVTDSEYWRKWFGDKAVKVIIDKAGLLQKLTNSPNVSNWVNRLDNNLDSELLSKIDDAVTNDPVRLSLTKQRCGAFG